MKKVLIIILIIFVIGCKPKPEFTINGKQYYTKTYCVQSHLEMKYGYHYGYSQFHGDFRYHWGFYNERICDVYKKDTIEIK